MVSEIADGARTPGETVMMDVDAILDRPVARPSLLPELLNSRFGSEAGSLPRASSVPLAPPTYTVGYVYDAAMMSHSPDEGDEHPEQPQRIVAVHNTLLKHGCLSAMKRIPFGRVQREAVLLVHTEQHWRIVLGFKSTWHQYFLLILMRRFARSPDAAGNYRLKSILRARLAVCQSSDYRVRAFKLWRGHQGCTCRGSWGIKENARDRSSPRSSR